MCTILYKPVGEVLPGRKYLKYMIRHNPDGAGFMIPYNGKVYIRKGFWKYGRMRETLDRFMSEHGLGVKDIPIVIHSRIATSGKVSKGNTHPFPMKDDEGNLVKTEFRCDVGVAHNGVIRKTEGDLSDTQEFIRDVLSKIPFSELTAKEESDAVREAKRILGYDKIIFMNGEGLIVKFGFWSEHEKCYWSNSRYEAPKVYHYSTNEWKEKMREGTGYGMDECGFWGCPDVWNQSRARIYQTSRKLGVCDACSSHEWITSLNNTLLYLCGDCEKIFRDMFPLYPDKTYDKCAVCDTQTMVMKHEGMGKICRSCLCMIISAQNAANKENTKRSNVIPIRSGNALVEVKNETPS